MSLNRGGLVPTAMVMAIALTGCGGASQSTGRTTTPRSTTQITTTQPSSAQNVTADTAAAQAAALKLSDLPSGWTATPAANSAGAAGAKLVAPGKQLPVCPGVNVAELAAAGPADVQSPDFSDTNGGQVSSAVSYRLNASDVQHQIAVLKDPRLQACLASATSESIKHPTDPTETLPAGVAYGTPTAAALPFPTVGDQTVAFRLTIPITAAGQTTNTFIDFVFAIKGRVGVGMTYGSSPAPFPADQEHKYLQTVVGRLTNT